jgi:hypothetical protein
MGLCVIVPATVQIALPNALQPAGCCTILAFDVLLAPYTMPRAVACI